MGLHEKKRIKQQRKQTLRRSLRYAGIFVAASAGVVAVLLLVVKLLASTKEDFLASGDEFAQQGLWAEASISYRRAIELDGNYGLARYGLAKANLRQGQLRGAMAEYIRAADLLPDNLDARLQATKFLLVARRFEDARTSAERALALDPKNVEAQIAKATALAKMVDMNTGLFEIQQAIRMDPKDSRSFMMLGAMKVGQRNLVEAEAAFKQAVELVPSSVAAKQALAAFYWKTGRLPEAETWLRRALQNDPAQLESNRRLAAFLVFVGRAAEAEAPLKSMAESTGTAPAQLALADYYLGQGRSADAKAVLLPLISGAGGPDGFAPARVRLARLDYTEGRRDEAHAGLSEALKKEPKNVDALVLRAQFFMAERDTVQAMRLAQDAVAAGPTSTDARLVLAESHARRSEVANAIRVFNEALQLNPSLEAAKVRLVQLQLLRGDVAAAVQLAEETVRVTPDSVAARLVRAEAYLAQGKLAQAESDLNLVLQSAPDIALAHARLGELHVKRRNAAAARREFDRATQLDPSSFEALRGRVALEIAERHPERAIVALEQRLKSTPEDTSVLMLAAAVHASTGDLKKQEVALRKIVDLDSTDHQAFVALANLYVDQNNLEEAREQYEGLTSGPAAVGAQTMMGLIFEAQKKPAQAIAMYEKVLAAAPGSVVAANNLAALYVDAGGNLDVALQLAQDATRSRPDSALFNDTLGTIYMKKGLPEQAVRAFQVSVKAEPTQLDFRFRLGQAYMKAGDRRRAAEEFRFILKQKPDFRLAQLALEEMALPSRPK